MHLPLHPAFLRIDVSPEMQRVARYHAHRRTEHIKRQFEPRNPPLSEPESNYIGALGELAIRFLVSGEIALENNYDAHQVDRGDISIQGKVYDIKTEALPAKFYKLLYCGQIKPYQPYGCRVWTARHEHHLQKYTGGIIFVAVPIPTRAKETRVSQRLRQAIIEFARQLIIVGYATPDQIRQKTATWNSPPHPVSGRQLRYNSPNYIFHHPELTSVKKLFSHLE